MALFVSLEFLLLLLFFFVLYHMVKYRNPYKLYMEPWEKGVEGLWMIWSASLKF